MNAIQKNYLPIKLIIADMENCSNSSTEHKTNRKLLDELLLNRLIVYVPLNNPHSIDTHLWGFYRCNRIRNDPALTSVISGIYPHDTMYT